VHGLQRTEAAQLFENVRGDEVAGVQGQVCVVEPL
jgi:hypothetical protein